MSGSRAGRSVTISISLGAADVAERKGRAHESNGGTLPAEFGEAARWSQQREARQRLVTMLGGSTLTPARAAAIDAEQSR